MFHCEHANIPYIWCSFMRLFGRDVISWIFSFNFLGISISFDRPWYFMPYNSHYDPFVSTFFPIIKFISVQFQRSCMPIETRFCVASQNTILSLIVRKSNFVYYWIDMFCSVTNYSFVFSFIAKHFTGKLNYLPYFWKGNM